MDIIECAKRMIASSGKSARQVSRDLGKSPNYMAATFANRSDMSASNVARVAKLLGWRLVFRKDDIEMEVTPRADSDQGPTD